MNALRPITPAAVLVALLTGCSSLATPPKTPPTTTSTSAAPLTREAYLAELASMYGITDPPQVAVVEETTPDQNGLAKRAACLRDAGWSVTMDDSGGMLVDEVRKEQEADLNLAQYICEAAYPVAARYTNQTAEQQLSSFYDYLVTTYVPCVTQLGYTVPDAPTKDTYLASRGAAWNPSGEVDLQATAQGTTLADIDKKCPQTMPLDAQAP